MRKLSIVVIALLSFSACKKDAPLSKCGSVICTPTYAVIQAQITYSGTTSAQLDEVYTVNSQTGERIDYTQNLGAGYYIVLNDSYRQKMLNKTIDFHLMGIREGVVVMDEPYTITADCCHVKKTYGKDIIVVR